MMKLIRVSAFFPGRQATGILLLLNLLFGFRPVLATNFFGATLCHDHVTTSLSLPEDSGLRLASVETGEDAGLLMLLYATRGDAMENLDVLMTRVTGHSGTREGDSMQWSGHKILAYASLVKKGTLAMAVSSSDTCTPPQTPVSPAGAAASTPQPEDTPSSGISPDLMPPPAAAISPPETPQAPEAVHELAALDEEADFRLEGPLRWSPGPKPWIDVMGVIQNRTIRDYRLAAFDLSLYNKESELLCVDTISIGMLKAGQTRAFRDALNCPGTNPANIRKFRVQFSGGY